MNKFTIFTIILSFLTLPLNFNQKKLQLQNFPIGKELNEKNLTLYMEYKHVKFIHLTLAQAKHESGHFTSKICKDNHNLFGMRKAEIRPTTAIGIKNRYAAYQNWEQSVDDFILFQGFVMKKVKTKQGYIRFISYKYAADKNYYKKLKKYL